MCVIYYAQNVKGNNNPEAISKILDNALSNASYNPDGWGYLLPEIENAVVKMPKQFSKADKISTEKLFSENKIALLHLRNTTHGNNTAENTQPINLDRIDVLHNGMFEGKGYPTTSYGYAYTGYYHGIENKKDKKRKLEKSDTYVFASAINKQVSEGKSVIQAMKGELGKLSGFWRLFVYDKVRKTLYFTSNDTTFSLLYDPTTGQIIGSTLKLESPTEKKPSIGSFYSEYSVNYKFTPKADYIYKVEGLNWKQCDKISKPIREIPQFQSWNRFTPRIAEKSMTTSNDIPCSLTQKYNGCMCYQCEEYWNEYDIDNPYHDKRNGYARIN